MVHLGDFFRKIPLCIGLLFCLIWSNSLYAQVDLEDEEEVKPALDTEMVMSPLYMPVDYDYISNCILEKKVSTISEAIELLKKDEVIQFVEKLTGDISRRI